MWLFESVGPRFVGECTLGRGGDVFSRFWVKEIDAGCKDLEYGNVPEVPKSNAETKNGIYPPNYRPKHVPVVATPQQISSRLPTSTLYIHGSTQSAALAS